MKQRVLVVNVATNFRILVASTENLGALATVSGAISCPELLKNLSLTLHKIELIILVLSYLNEYKQQI